MDQESPVAPLGLCIALDADFYYLIASYAQRSGLRTIHIMRSSEYLSQVHQLSPAVVILEADSPVEHSTWETVTELKKDRAAQDIPVIVFSWLDEEEVALEKGVDIFTRKPIMYSDFLDALNSVGICQKATDAE